MKENKEIINREETPILSFVFLKSYFDSIEIMSDENQLKTYKTICNYVFLGINPSDNESEVVKVAFTAMKPNIDNALKNYVTKVTNGKKGGRPKTKNLNKPNNNLNKPNNKQNESNEKQEKAKKPYDYNYNYDYDLNINNNNNVVDNDLKEIINFYNNNIGLIPPHNAEVLKDYLKDMNKDVILYAMKLSVEADKRNIQYIKAILNNWQIRGVKTLQEAEKESKRKPIKEDKFEFNKNDIGTTDWNNLYDN